MAVYFTADTHFGDHRVINIHQRPFASTDEMDELLIDRWNSVVQVDDVVWHLGDFGRSARQAALLARLHGSKHLVRGNNDPEAIAVAQDWVSCADYVELELEGRALVLCHYPFRAWKGQHRGAINLHGHSHGRLKPLPRQFDVGVDARDYAPVTLATLLGSTKERASTI